jgi:cytoplasmic iron level regulating protein YaaA (DUF328/UPF0246 family)
MKTKFEDFLNEYKETFNVDNALKDVIKNAFGKEKCDCKTIINKIYKESENGTLPTAIKKVVKEYPALKDFERELIAVMEEDSDGNDDVYKKGKKSNEPDKDSKEKK